MATAQDTQVVRELTALTAQAAATYVRDVPVGTREQVRHEAGLVQDFAGALREAVSRLPANDPVSQEAHVVLGTVDHALAAVGEGQDLGAVAAELEAHVHAPAAPAAGPPIAREWEPGDRVDSTPGRFPLAREWGSAADAATGAPEGVREAVTHAAGLVSELASSVVHYTRANLEIARVDAIAQSGGAAELAAVRADDPVAVRDAALEHLRSVHQETGEALNALRAMTDGLPAGHPLLQQVDQLVAMNGAVVQAASELTGSANEFVGDQARLREGTTLPWETDDPAVGDVDEVLQDARVIHSLESELYGLANQAARLAEGQGADGTGVDGARGDVDGHGEGPQQAFRLPPTFPQASDASAVTDGPGGHVGQWGGVTTPDQSGGAAGGPNAGHSGEPVAGGSSAPGHRTPPEQDDIG